MLNALKSSLAAITGGTNSLGINGSSPVRRDSAASYPGSVNNDIEEDGDAPGYGRSTRNGDMVMPGTASSGGNNGGSPANAIGTSVPRVKHTMARIHSMMRKLNPELLDTLSYPAASKQVAELQKLLQDYVIPKDVLDAYAIHDGQDTFSIPQGGENGEIEGSNGFIYGLWWMSIEEIIEEYTFWRRLDISNPPSPATATTTKNINNKKKDIKGKGKQQHQQHTARVPSQDAFLFGSEMDPRTVRATMRSCPEGFVREEYSHPSWLPLLKDGYGNYIGVDLDPPTLSEDEKLQLNSSSAPPILPARGQVIAFGREIDTKTVLWNGWGDSNAYDNLGGGGWARFLASFADDLSASPALHKHSRYSYNSSTYSTRGGNGGGGAGSDDDDEDAYRHASSGRQEQSGHHRNGTALDWLDGNPAYSGLGTIEALVERSRRIWSSVGMPMPVSTPAMEIVPLVNGDAPPPSHSPYDQDNSASLDRSRKPPPLTFTMPGTGAAGRQDQQQVSPKSAPHPLDAGRTITNPLDSATSIGARSNPETARNNPAFMQGTYESSSPTDTAHDQNQALEQDPNASTTALVQPTSVDQQDNATKPPLSPEPSLILSPPSPKNNVENFSPFPSVSPTNVKPTNNVSDSNASNPTTPTTAQHPTSIASPSSLANASLQSPARVSPGQAARYAQRQGQNQPQYQYQNQYQQRHASIDSQRRASASSSSSRTKRPPPPPPMPLGLPTLEFGNGIWEDNDTNDGGDVGTYGYEKNSFEVVIGDRR
ncbi:hypothetical protein P389DRAFT_210164 [Cystobasidium minutum MCA 4210]|uniref:uncharacterized protein n=1 Tax=Cystobasidium minutum MCA 4210 TaxID=1397322 RepID=UPI0034CF10F7|eukprot:jgi/Rhomi1/210164/estExt_Genemark1.C_3_t20384